MADRLDEDAARRGEWIDSGPPAQKFTFIYPPDIRLLKREWLVSKLLPVRGLGVMFGPSGCGKSFLATDLAMSVATGQEFLGKPTRKAGVIYVAAEDADGVQARVLAWLQHNEYPGDEACIAIVPEAPDLWQSDGAEAEALIDAIIAENAVMSEKGAPAGLVIFDTMRDVLPGMNENGSDEMGLAMRLFRKVSQALNALIIIVHHVPKYGDGEDPRGSGALIGSADIALGARVDEIDDQFVRSMWLRKQRNGPDARGDKSLRWVYSLETVQLPIMADDGDVETSCVIKFSGAPVPKRAQERKLSDAAIIVRRALDQLLSEGAGKHPPMSCQCPAGQQAMPVDDVRERARSLGICDPSSSDPMQASKKAFQRGKQQLIAKNRAFEREGWMWPSRY